MSLDSGGLDCVVSIRAVATTLDAGGAPILGLGSEVASRRGKVEWIAGREVVETGQVKGFTDVMVTIGRYDLVLNQRLRITQRWDNRTFTCEVLRVDHSGDGAFTVAYCRELRPGT